MALAGSWSDVGGAHIQAFTFSFQDHGRLSIVHVSKHSLFSWRRHSQDHGRLSGVWCGVLWWCVCVVCVKLGSLSLLFSLLPLLFPLLFLSSFCFSFSLAPSLTLALALVLSLLFFLLSSLLLTLLFPSRKQTLYKALINKHGVQLWGVWMWCGAWYVVHSNCQRIARNVPTSPPPSSLSSLLPPSHTQKKERELFFTGIFPARNLIFITVLN